MYDFDFYTTWIWPSFDVHIGKSRKQVTTNQRRLKRTFTSSCVSAQLEFVHQKNQKNRTRNLKESKNMGKKRML